MHVHARACARMHASIYPFEYRRAGQCELLVAEAMNPHTQLNDKLRAYEQVYERKRMGCVHARRRADGWTVI